MQTNELTIIVETSGLEKSKAQMMLSHFTGFFDKAKEWEQKAKTIVITDVSQKEEMKLAREARLELKDIRVNAEKVRKEMKEQSLREGKAIDGIANIIKALVVPIEEYLENQEKFAEKKEAETKEKLYQERIEKLSEFVHDPSMYNIREMSNETFAKLLENSKISHEAVKQAEIKAEEERKQKEREMAEQREKEKIELERLRKEREIKEKQILEERAKANADAKRLELERQKEKEAREKVERELKKRKEADEKSKRDEQARIEADKKFQEDEKKKAMMAPDKEKIYAFSNAIASVSIPRCSSKEAQVIIEKAEDDLRIAMRKMCNAIDKLK